jgi:hypothetical protein
MDHLRSSLVALVVTAAVGLVAAGAGASTIGALVIGLGIGVAGLALLEVRHRHPWTPWRRHDPPVHPLTMTPYLAGQAEIASAVPPPVGIVNEDPEQRDSLLPAPSGHARIPRVSVVRLRVSNTSPVVARFCAEVENVEGGREEPVVPWLVTWRDHEGPDARILPESSALLLLAELHVLHPQTPWSLAFLRTQGDPEVVQFQQDLAGATVLSFLDIRVSLKVTDVDTGRFVRKLITLNLDRHDFTLRVMVE